MIASNPVTIFPGDGQVTITITAKSDWATRIFLLVFNILLLVALMFSIQESIPLLLLLVLVLEFWLALFSCWNLFGKEVIILSGKALTCRHHYGPFTAPAVVKEVSRTVRCEVISSVQENAQVLQQLQFESDDENGISYVVYKVTLRVKESDARMIREQVTAFFHSA